MQTYKNCSIIQITKGDYMKRMKYLLIMLLILNSKIFSITNIPSMYPFVSPSTTKVSIPYTKRKPSKRINTLSPFTNEMIKIKAFENNKIVATGDGVLKIQTYSGFRGQRYKVEIDHQNGFVTTYLNVLTLDIDENEKKISKGDLLGNVTAQTFSDNYLFLTIKYYDDVINPELLFLGITNVEELLKLTANIYDYQPPRKDFKFENINLKISDINLSLFQDITEYKSSFGEPISEKIIKHPNDEKNRFDKFHYKFKSFESLHYRYDMKSFVIDTIDTEAVIFNSIRVGSSLKDTVLTIGQPHCIILDRKNFSDIIIRFYLLNQDIFPYLDISDFIYYDVNDDDLERKHVYISFEESTVNRITLGVNQP